MQCRITGTLTFAAVSGYLLHIRSTTPRSLPRDRAVLAGLAAVFGAASVARAVVGLGDAPPAEEERK
jgi:hypothetical protein